MTTKKKKTAKTCKNRTAEGRKCRGKARKGGTWCYLHDPDSTKVLCARMSPGGHQCRNAATTGQKWCQSHSPTVPLRPTRKKAEPGVKALRGPCRCAKCFAIFRRGPLRTAAMLKPTAAIALREVALAQAPNYCDRCCIALFPPVFTEAKLGAAS